MGKGKRGTSMNVHVRNVDAAAVAKIKENAANKGMSQEEYLRQYLNSLAVLDELKDLDLKYSALVKKISMVIEQNTDVMKKFIEKNI